VEQFVCPGCDRFYRERRPEVGPASTAPARHIAQQHLRAHVPGGDLLDGAAAAHGTARFQPPQQDDTSRRGGRTVKKRTAVHGLALWWSAWRRRLFRRDRSIPRRTGAAVSPALAPIALEAGQTLAVAALDPPPAGAAQCLTLSVRDTSGRDLSRQALDLEKGFLP
jgi:hypothetical protein